MTAPDPRLDEIQARLEPALFHAPYIVDGRRVIQANNHPAIAPYMLSDNSMPVIAEFIANAPADVAYLLAELRKAHEALAAVSAIEEVLDGWDALIPFHDAEESQRWYSLGKRHAAERIRTEIAEARAAVAAAKGDEE